MARLIVFDCESYIYRGCTACKVLRQDPVDKYIFTESYDLRQGLRYFKEICDYLMEKLQGMDLLLVFGDKDNFRKIRYPQAEYKAQRKPAPEIYKYLKEAIQSEYNWVSLMNLEADDTCRIIYEDNQNYQVAKVLVSIDKDFNTFEGEVFNPNKPDKGIVFTTKQEAEYNLMKQVIVGDTADNYKGLEGYGEVKATKFLDEEPRIWDDVRQLFKENNQLNDYLVTRNLATIVGIDRYDFTTGKVKEII